MCQLLQTSHQPGGGFYSFHPHFTEEHMETRRDEWFEEDHAIRPCAMPSNVSCRHGGHGSDLERWSASSLQLLMAAGLEWVLASYAAWDLPVWEGRKASLLLQTRPRYCWVLGKALKLQSTFSDSTPIWEGKGALWLQARQKSRVPMWPPLVLGRGMKGVWVITDWGEWRSQLIYLFSLTPSQPVCWAPGKA